ncbi:MAG: hypothetical protein KGO02_18855 [Alphaproteobacteria bacterium]|nr:hypothetical protein [Alphaproteobacteria bacterium]
MPTATLTYGTHSATLSWPDTATPAEIQGGINKAKQAMIQAYGQLPDAQSDSSKPQDISSQGTPAETSAPSQSTTDSLITAIRNGAGDFVGGLAQLNQLADNAIAKTTGTKPDTAFDQSLANLAQTIHGNENYQPEPVSGFGSAAHDAAGLIAGAAPSMLGAALTGPAAPYVLAASAAGNTLHDRMSAQGESSPSMGDLAAAGGDALLNGLGGKAALGLGKVPGLGALGADAKSAVVRALGRMATNAGTGAVVGAGNYAANSAGTGQMTASGLADSAGQAAATGGLLTGMVDGASALKDMPTSRAAAAIHPEQAASTVRVAQELANRVQATKNTTAPTSATDAATGLSGQLQGELSASMGRLKQSGALSENDRLAVLQPLLDAAKAGTLHPGDSSVPTSALAQFDSLGLPEADKTALRNGLLDLSTVTRDGTTDGTLRPLVDKLLNTSTAKAVESLGGAALGFMHGGEPGALLGGMAGAVAPKVASALAGGVDSLTGANIPPVLRQQAAARLALRRAGAALPGSSLVDLQAARTAYAPPSGPTPEQQGQQAAAQNQAAMLAKYGPDHPIGRAARAALVDGGFDNLMQRATAQYSFGQPLRDAAPAGKAWDTAAKHQLTLNAAEETPGGNVGIDAINAAANDLVRGAERTQRLAGGQPQDDSGKPAGDSSPVSGSPTPPSPVQPPSESQATLGGPFAQPSASGLMGLSDYLTSQALWRGGMALSLDDLKAGLDRAAGAGALTPAQHDAIGQHITDNLPLHHASGAATAALESVLSHALAVKADGDTTPLATAQTQGTGNATTDVRDHVKYATAAAARQSTYSTAMHQLTAEGMPEAAQAVSEARHVSNAGTRAAILDTLDPVQRAKVRALLGSKLYGR